MKKIQKRVVLKSLLKPMFLTVATVLLLLPMGIQGTARAQWALEDGLYPEYWEEYPHVVITRSVTGDADAGSGAIYTLFANTMTCSAIGTAILNPIGSTYDSAWTRAGAYGYAAIRWRGSSPATVGYTFTKTRSSIAVATASTTSSSISAGASANLYEPGGVSAGVPISGSSIAYASAYHSFTESNTVDGPYALYGESLRVSEIYVATGYKIDALGVFHSENAAGSSYFSRRTKYITDEWVQRNYAPYGYEADSDDGYALADISVAGAGAGAAAATGFTTITVN